MERISRPGMEGIKGAPLDEVKVRGHEGRVDPDEEMKLRQQEEAEFSQLTSKLREEGYGGLALYIMKLSVAEFRKIDGVFNVNGEHMRGFFAGLDVDKQKEVIILLDEMKLAQDNKAGNNALARLQNLVY
jgi:hypothetical protein